eukprot:5596728-Alexandrium_andersonii.AAC.1
MRLIGHTNRPHFASAIWPPSHEPPEPAPRGGDDAHVGPLKRFEPLQEFVRRPLWRVLHTPHGGGPLLLGFRDLAKEAQSGPIASAPDDALATRTTKAEDPLEVLMAFLVRVPGDPANRVGLPLALRAVFGDAAHKHPPRAGQALDLLNLRFRNFYEA